MTFPKICPQLPLFLTLSCRPPPSAAWLGDSPDSLPVGLQVCRQTDRYFTYKAGLHKQIEFDHSFHSEVKSKFNNDEMQAFGFRSQSFQLPQEDSAQYFQFKKKSKTDPRALKECIEKRDVLTQQGEDKACSNQIDNLLQKQYETFTLDTYTHYILEAEKTIKGKSTVLALRDIMSADSLDFYHNIFCNFGNVVRVMRKKSRQSVFIQFQNEEFAGKSFEQLKDLKIKGMSFQLKFWNYHQLLIQDTSKTQITFYSQDFHRFKQAPCTINPPSAVLHISNLSKDHFKQTILQEIFSQFASPQKLQLSTSIYRMAFVRFGSIERAALTMGKLNNRFFGGKPIQIAFTKTII